MSNGTAGTNQTQKLIIGVTGNIATGKSAVMHMAAEQGALTIDADKIVHHLMDSDLNLQAAIAVAFGSEVRRPDGRIDRRTLGDIVFNDPNALGDLEEMLHPAVRDEIADRIAAGDAPVVLIEAIKLLEGGLADACHQIWVTRCGQKRQLERLRVCRGLSTETAVARIKAQPPQEDKVALADIVIDTNGLMSDTEAQFELAWSRLPGLAELSVPKKQLVPRKVKPTPKPTPAAAAKEPEVATEPPAVAEPAETPESAGPTPETASERSWPEDLQVRRARPSDIPSILLLIQKATDGAVKMKRTELLMALSERGYFIGQIGTEISAIMGWSIDSQVARIDQVYIYPLAAAQDTGMAILDEVETSANGHVCQIIVAFLANNAPTEVRQIFDGNGFTLMELEDLARNWQLAVEESQPDDTFCMIKILRDTRPTA